MTDRGMQLHAAAYGQTTELLALSSTLNAQTVRLPCPGREKLGDGTIAASLRHTADNYQRIAAFVQTSDGMADKRAMAGAGGHRVPRFLRALGDGPAHHSDHAPDGGPHQDRCTASDIDLDRLAEQLSTTRDALGRIAELSDTQLNTIPPKDSFRFCDGQRTLEHVLASLLKHQSHQIQALKEALTRARGTTDFLDPLDGLGTCAHPRRDKSSTDPAGGSPRFSPWLSGKGRASGTKTSVTFE
jgi:hypothetical protein